MAKPSFPTAAAAQAAFYAALEQADLAAMMAVWESDEHIVCVHPGGPRLTGQAAVRESWRRIFAGGPAMGLSISDEQVLEQGPLCVRIVHEHIVTDGRRHPPVVATNVLRRSHGSWRLVSHHASPTPGTGPRMPSGPLH